MKIIVRKKPKITQIKLADVPVSGEFTDAWEIEIFDKDEIRIDC